MTLQLWQYSPSLSFLSPSLRSLPPNYPCVPPIFEIEANKSGSFSYRDADDLFHLLMMESFKRVGGMMVYDLVTMAQDYMPGRQVNKSMRCFVSALFSPLLPFLPLALVQRKCEEAARREEADLKRKRAMELEEALRDGCKARGVPREVNT